MRILWIVGVFSAIVGLGMLGFVAFRPLTPSSKRESIFAKGTVQQVAKEVRDRTGTWPRSSEDSIMLFAERRRLIAAHASLQMDAERSLNLAFPLEDRDEIHHSFVQWARIQTTRCT